MKSSDLFEVRPYRKSDKNFILATWLRGLKYGNEWFNLIPSDIYFKTYQTVIEKLLDSPSVSIKVCCLKEENDAILGYSILSHNETVLNWAFTKSAWRKIGIMKSLVPSTVTAVTHVTDVGVSLLKKTPNVVFNPFLLGGN